MIQKYLASSWLKCAKLLNNWVTDGIKIKSSLEESDLNCLKRWSKTCWVLDIITWGCIERSAFRKEIVANENHETWKINWRWWNKKHIDFEINWTISQSKVKNLVNVLRFENAIRWYEQSIYITQFTISKR